MQKVVLITGGSSGIGRSIGEFLVSRGFTVYGTSRNPERLSDFKAFQLLKLDVADENSIREAIQYIINKSGRLDVLINNAGMGITGAVEEIPADERERVFTTNLYGPIDVMKAVLPVMREQQSGLVINITSIAGYMGLPYRGLYSATKGALELVTEAMRMECRDFGIRLTNLAPGDFATNIAAGRYHAPVKEDSPYREAYGRTLKMMDEHVSGGGDPLKVAEMVLKIINTKEPKVHYKVGAFMQKFSIVLKRILTDKMYEKLLLNHYKL